MSFPTRRQSTTSSQPSLASQTNTYVFASSCQAGNLIVVCLAGDKNTGTLSVSDDVGDNGGANPWVQWIEQPGSQGSLYVYRKVAVGGETTITATTSSTSSTGNSGYAEEAVDDGGGAWQLLASALAALNTADRSSVASGTTDVAEHDGRALAVAMVDSLSNLTSDTNPTFSNGFTRINVPERPSGSGGGNAGCYVGTQDIAADTTTSTTFSTNGGSDALSLGIVVFGRVESTEPIEKVGSDTSTGTESGGVTAELTGADAGTGAESGSLELSGSDAGVGSEDGYSGEERLGGDVGSGAETGDTGATSTGGDTATGAETYDSAATLDPGPDTATGAEQGHIAIPGADSAVGADTHDAPTQVTSTSGEAATGADGGYVETLFGDLIIALFVVDPETGELIALPDYESLDITRERNSKGALRHQYPVGGKGFDLLRETVTAKRDIEFELWTNGTAVGALRGYLQEASGDDVVADNNGEDGSWQFAGSFLEVRTDEAVVYPQDRGSLITDPDTGEQTYSNARRELLVNADTPGELIALLLDQAQARGTLTDIERDFTTTHDSNGVAWAGLLTAKFSPGVTYTQILNKLVDLHLVEWAIVWDWETQTKVFKLWNAEGRGADLTTGPRPVTLRRGRNLLDAPRAWSVREAVTTVLAAGSEGVYDDATDATALARRGRNIEAYTSFGNASDEEAVFAFAQAELATMVHGLLSVSHGIGMLPGEPRPIIAFDIGDWLLSFSGTIAEKLRVVQWTLAIDNARSLSGTVTLNDTIMDIRERLLERINAITSGEAVVGTSEPGGSSEPDRTPPAAPEGVVASSIAYQDIEHGPGQTLAMITVGWLPVTTNADGSDSPLVQAAVYIRDKIEDDAANPPEPDPDQPDGGPDYDPILEDWTWKNCPQVVQDFNDPLLELYEDDGSPADELAWLNGYIAEATQTPTAADDIAGYRVRYAYQGLFQVGGIPSSDPFPEEDRFYYEATPPNGTAGTIYSFGGVEGGASVRVEVCAFDRSGNQGAWTSITHESSNDATPPPVPSAPTGLKTWFRTLDVPWNGLGAEGEVMPVDFSHARVWVGQGADLTLPEDIPGEPRLAQPFDPASIEPQYVANLYAAGTWNVPDLPIGVGYYARLQTVDRTGNASAGSAVVGPVTAQQLVGQDILDGIIDATKIGPDSIESQHIVNGAITIAKIGEAQIISAHIGTAQINSAHIETVNAGSIVTGTMTATVTVSGSLWTSTDPNATRLGFSAAGLHLYRTRSGGGSDLVGEWRTSDGGMLVTGTFQSALSGARIHIDPDGSFRLYPVSGTNYSQIKNESGEMVWRGPLDSGQRSGRVNVNTLGVGINFSAERNLLENIRAEIVVFDRRTRMQAPFMAFVVDEGWTNPAGGVRRAQFSTVQSNGTTRPNSFVSYYCSDVGNRAGGFFGQGAGIKFEAGQVLITTDELEGWGIAKAADFVGGQSSIEVKHDIEDIRAVVNPLEALGQARARVFRFDDDPPEADRVIGVIAEEMPPEVQRLGPDGKGGEVLSVSLNAWLALLHGGFNQLLDQEVRSVTGSANVPNGNYNSPDEIIVDVTWDEQPLEIPSDVTALALVGMPTAMGKVRCRYVPGSATLDGCQIRVSFTGLTAVTGQLPLVIETWGRYVWTPPYAPEA